MAHGVGERAIADPYYAVVGDPALEERVSAVTGARWFDVNACSVDYTRDLGTFHSAQIGLGANLSLYGIPDAIKPYYGDQPVGVNVYLRVRLK
ncbi:MAG TPA: hypothetical protein VMU45_08005 [Candidatus Eisenbacteria bacterium]|nr:hypothetical protein [Candidatus Eisenbacteria bacterium]